MDPPRETRAKTCGASRSNDACTKRTYILIFKFIVEVRALHRYINQAINLSLHHSLVDWLDTAGPYTSSSTKCSNMASINCAPREHIQVHCAPLFLLNNQEITYQEICSNGEFRTQFSYGPRGRRT